MPDPNHLLSSRQMAAFVTDGYLRFDALVPDALNRAALPELDGGLRGAPAGTPLAQLYPAPSAIGSILRMPEVEGIIASLTGPDPVFDHHAIHTRAVKQTQAQHLHGDAVIDTRTHFDIQLMYYPHDVPIEMGPTLVVPGSHFRRINESDIGRYQNLRGQIPMACQAGTLLALHHGIWHCGGQNKTDQVRFMFKVRLNPSVRQLLRWNTADLHDPEVATILRRQFPWYESATGRLEIMNRARLWRFLTGDETYDTDYWLTRVENMPERVAV